MRQLAACLTCQLELTPLLVFLLGSVVPSTHALATHAAIDGLHSCFCLLISVHPILRAVSRLTMRSHLEVGQLGDEAKMAWHKLLLALVPADLLLMILPATVLTQAIEQVVLVLR